MLRLRWANELRTGWRSILLLALLVGLGGGMALTAIAGARRADTAMRRFVAYSEPGTGVVFFGDSPFSPPPVAGAAADSLSPPPYASGVLSLPQVVAYYRVLYLFTATDGNQPGVVNTFGLVDAAATRTADRPLVVAGRLPNPDAPLEALMNEQAADKLHLHVGSTIHVHSYSAAELQSGSITGSAQSAPSDPTGPSYDVQVTGIVRFPSDVNAIVPLAAEQDVVYEGQQNVFLTPAFVTQLARDLGIPVQQMASMNVFGVRLRHGAADWQSFVGAATKLTDGSTTPVRVERGDSFGIESAAHSAGRGFRVEAIALALFGALAGLVTLLLVGEALSRQLYADAVNRSVLRALGATRRQLATAAMVRPTVVALGGALLALLVATAASPLTPMGSARKAEIHPGFAFNAAVLLGTAGALVLLLVGSAAISTWVATRPQPNAGEQRQATEPGLTAKILEGRSVPLSAAFGVRYAFRLGGARRSIPLAPELLAATAAVAGLVAALTFGGSLNHLIDTPGQQGWNWDVMVGNPNDTADLVAQGSSLLAANDQVTAYSAIGELGAVNVDGVTIPQLLAFDQLKGSVHPPLLEGRGPATPGEITLASHTMQLVHKQIGDTVQVTGPDGVAHTFRVVGRMVAPSVGDVLTNSLGDGGWIDSSFVHQQWQSPSNPSGTPPDGADVLNVFAIKLAPGVSASAALANLRRDFGPTVLQQMPAEDVVNLQNVSGLPFVLAGLIALLGAATLGHALASSVRRRRQELAVLRTLGFVRRQVTAIVAWQATTFAALALAIGIPLGIACGRSAWSNVADSIYSVSPPIIPLAAVAVVVPATILVSIAVAAWPARAAGRLPAALAMRSE